MTDLAPLLDKPDTQDPENVKHIIDQRNQLQSVADAIIFGYELTALCGYKFVPTRDPDPLPVCEPCRLALAATT